MQLLSLFKEKIKLHSKKYRLIDKIDMIGLNRLYLKELRSILKEEYKLNKELKKEIKNLSKFVNLKLASKQLSNINKTTKKQLELLQMVRLRIFKHTNYERFKEECRKEVEQSKFFSEILKETTSNIQGVEIPKEEFKQGKLLVRQAQKTYSELLKAVGNVKKVRQKSKKLFLIGNKLKKTKLYEFIKYDVDLIIGKSMYMMKNPKKSKIKFVLASAYIVSPGTFELTGIYLFFRYTNKYIKLKKNKV